MNPSRAVGAVVATVLLVQPDGNVVAGYTQLNATFASTDVAVVRLMSSGRLDPTFGTSGVAVTRPPVTRRPIADAYVRGGSSADANFGSSAQLLAKLGVSDDNSHISYLKFDLRDVASVNRATFRLNGRLSNTTTSSVQTTVRAVANVTWTERTVTWRNRPAIGTALGSFTVRGTAAQWHDVDVTAYVQAERRAGRNVITLALHNSAHSSAQVQAASREAGSPAPALMIAP